LAVDTFHALPFMGGTKRRPAISRSGSKVV
jgi:hypothetical protein